MRTYLIILLIGFLMVSCAKNPGSRRYENLIYNGGFVDDPSLILNAGTEEFNFYAFKNGESVADVGCGTGWLSGYLAIAHDSMLVYAEDINKNAIKNAPILISRYEELDPTEAKNNFHFVVGTKSQTLFPKGTLDKIILRETFHHITQKNQILMDLYSQLKCGGLLFIYEPLVPFTTYNEACKAYVIEKAEIINTVKAQDFYLEDELELRGNPGNAPPWISVPENDVEDKVILKFIKRCL